MTHSEVPLVKHRQHCVGEPQQPQGVGDRGPVPPYRGGDVLLREVELLNEALVAARLVHRREVVTLQVFDQGKRQHRAIVDFPFDGRDPLPAQRLTGAQAALPGDQLEASAVGQWAHHDRLQQPGLLDRGLELLQRHRIHVAARLVGIGMDFADGELDQAALALGFLARGSE